MHAFFLHAWVHFFCHVQSFNCQRFIWRITWRVLMVPYLMLCNFLWIPCLFFFLALFVHLFYLFCCILKKHCNFACNYSAVTEDANRAIELKNGSSVGGRKIGVKHAMHRAPLEQRRPKGNLGWHGFTFIFYFFVHKFAMLLLLNHFHSKTAALMHKSNGGAKFSFYCGSSM